MDTRISVGMTGILFGVFLLFASIPLRAADLGETIEIQYLSSDALELRQKADALQSPALIYEYVRNTYDFAFYHGARNDTINTFFAEQANNVDQASLLIALYRYRNIPARYVVGTVRVMAAEAKQWFGITNMTLIKNLLERQGVENVTLATDQSYIEFEHVWVEALVFYDNYRGAGDTSINFDCAANRSQCRWIALDPSFKLREENVNAIDLFGQVPFDYTAYYNALANNNPALGNQNPVDIYEGQVLQHLQAISPGKALEDLPRYGAIRPDLSGLLPASLPYLVQGAVRRYDSVDDHDAAVPGIEQNTWAKNINIQINVNGTVFDGGTYRASQLNTVPLSFSYDPGSLFTPPRQVLRQGSTIFGVINLDGSNVDGLGNPIGVMTRYDLIITADIAPNLTPVQQTFQALEFGGYAVLAQGGTASNEQQVQRAATRLLNASLNFPIVFDANGVPYVDDNQNGFDVNDTPLLSSQAAMDALTGGLLETALFSHFNQTREAVQRLDAMTQVISPVTTFFGLASSVFQVDYTVGTTPFSILPGGLLLDIPIAVDSSWRIHDAATAANEQFDLIGHVSSALEHEVWQQLTGFDAVSTVRGIQIALANGATLLDARRNLTTNTVPTFMAASGYSFPEPAPFQPRFNDLFGTRPVTWFLNPDPGTVESFHTLLAAPTTTTASLRLSGLSWSSDNGWDAFVASVDNLEDVLLDGIAQFGANCTVNPPGFTFGGTDHSGPCSQVLSELQTFYFSIINQNAATTELFNYLDVAQGFNRTAQVFRSTTNLASDAPNSDTVRFIRDNAYIRDITQNWAAATIPDRQVDGGNFRFSVFNLKIFDQTDGRLIDNLFGISNTFGSANGGYVDQGLLADISTPVESATPRLLDFDNALYTNKELVAQTNNDLIRTPSTLDPISTVTGNMYHDETDFVIKGRGLDYVFTRSYNSAPAQSNVKGPMGYGWTHSYNMQLRANDYKDCPNCSAATKPENADNITSSVSYTDERGGSHVYLVDEATFATTPPAGEFDTLAFDTPSAGLHTLTFRNGVKYVFEGPSSLKSTPGQMARLKSIEDPYNNVLNLTYDAQGRLDTVTDNSGIPGRTGLKFVYYTTSGLLQFVRDWTGREWEFFYISGDRLAGFFDPLNFVHQYTYQGTSRQLEGVVKPVARNGNLVFSAFDYYRDSKAYSNFNSVGESEFLEYDPYRGVTKLTDRRGFIKEFTYDPDTGGLSRLRNPDGSVQVFANTADGLRYKKTDGLGFETQYSFMSNGSISAVNSDNFGRVSREIDALGAITNLTYDIYDQPGVTTDKRNNPTSRTYYTATNATTDAVAGKLKEIRATLNGVANVLLEERKYYADINHPAFGRLKQRIEYIDPADNTRQRVSDYVYESNGINLQSLTVSGATSGGAVTRNFTYDNLGRLKTESLLRETSAFDSTLIPLTTTFTYDELDRVVRVADPRGDLRDTVYDGNGQVFQEIVHHKQADGTFVSRTEATHAYDAFDRRISTTDVLNNTTTFDYDAADHLIARTDANGHTTRFEYDSMNRQSAVIDANGHRTEFSYDLAGRLVAVKDANGNTTRFEYDKLGRQTKVITPLGFETRTQYDANGNVTHSIDANTAAGLQPPNNQGATVYRIYDELNRPTLERDALNGDTQFTYDLLGNITKIIDAEGQETQFKYDDLGRRIEVVDPVIETPVDKTDVVFAYDRAGNRLFSQDRADRFIIENYDVLNRRITRQDFNATTNAFETFTYDAFGDLVGIANDGITYTYTYTPRHELASKTDSRLGKSLSWTYDPVGNVATKTDYQGDITEFQYDSTNRLVALRNPAYLQVSYHYDGAGRLLNRILSNGAQTDYRYDADDRLTGLKNRSADGSVVEDLAYQRDRVGNITQISDAASGRTVDYGYDPLYRLAAVDSTDNSEDRGYTYDAVGNRTVLIGNGTTYYYCYDATDCSQGPAGNRLVNIRTGSPAGPLYRQFTYDDSGRITSKQDGAGSLIYSAVYGAFGRTDRILTPTGTNDFAYDPNEFRVDKDGTLYHLEGEHLEATYSNSGVLTNRYLRGVVVDEIVNGYQHHSVDPNDWTNYTFHHDHLNSVTALTGHAGSIDETTDYDAFGSPTLALPGSGNDLLFTGREYDRSSRLFYYRARYYDPEIGRFISEDPLGFEAGINFYAYVNNNPMNFNDPNGKDVVGVNAGGEVIADPSCFSCSVPGGRVSLSTILAFDTETFELGLFAQKEIGIGKSTGIGSAGLFVNALIGGKGSTFNDIRGKSLSVGGSFGFPNNTGVGFSISDPGIDSKGPQIVELGFSPLTTQGPTLNASLGNAVQIGSSSAVADFRDNVNQSIVNGLESFIGGRTINDFLGSSSSNGASGGFVLYPSKPNTNQLRSVYSK